MTHFLIVVDVQKDFTIGTMAVPYAKEIIPVVNQKILEAQVKGDSVIYTMDMHRVNHPSFLAYGGQWPPHCIEGTEGQTFDADLIVIDKAIILVKGYLEEAYQATLWPYIRPQDSVEVVGLATDYCVFATAQYLLDFCHPKIVEVNLNACRGIWHDYSPSKFVRRAGDSGIYITGLLSPKEVSDYNERRDARPLPF